ncbi:uncharacterized protein BJ171DRAFT_512565 [Polychytrium aggregatum]|uniref:uncharacterized protein n=1 Tax=Polychytrium aggregatum TaxID=110093 RepID=UPI0022FEE64B|nr:uncharacterized protein BJ171DRAFT_512565 [Polychytrium aggregatum]KAI9202904.1 hypothetical protein BJ171DRAFT_512565 [Polychytrium aggregatum]
MLPVLRSLRSAASPRLLVSRYASTSAKASAPHATSPLNGHHKDEHHDDHHHEPEGYEPTGYFLGRAPNDRTRYAWEPVWYYGYYGSIVAFVIAYIYMDKPTLHEQSKLEAHKRLVERGESLDWPLPPSYALVKKSE